MSEVDIVIDKFLKCKLKMNLKTSSSGIGNTEQDTVYDHAAVT